MSVYSAWVLTDDAQDPLPLTVATSRLLCRLERPLGPISLPLGTECRFSLEQLAGQMPSSPQLPVNVASYHSELAAFAVRNSSSPHGQGP